MFGRKSKEVKYNTKECTDIFQKYIEDEENYKHYEDLYKEIRETYEDKIKKKQIDINVERVRLKTHTGKYNTFIKSFHGNIIILAMSTLINSIIVGYSVSDYSSISKFLIIFGCGILFCSFLIFTIYKTVNNDDGFVKDLCLQVLDDIEKELMLNNSTIASEEAAATTEVTYPKEQAKQHTNSNNGNWSVNISSTSFVDMVEGTYKAFKFISRLVKNKKKSS